MHVYNILTVGQFSRKLSQILIALRIVSDLAEGIGKNGYFSLMADEYTDVSNKELLAICLSM